MTDKLNSHMKSEHDLKCIDICDRFGVHVATVDRNVLGGSFPSLASDDDFDEERFYRPDRQRPGLTHLSCLWPKSYLPFPEWPTVDVPNLFYLRPKLSVADSSQVLCKTASCRTCQSQLTSQLKANLLELLSRRVAAVVFRSYM